MKKKRTLLTVLLSCVCLVCAAIGLTACNTDDNPGNGGNGGEEPKIVVKTGETAIGTVTADAVKYGIEGTVGTIYALTAKVGDASTDGVTLKVGDTEDTTVVVFSYVANCEVTVTAVSDNVANVTLVLEAQNTLTATNPLTLTGLKENDGVFIYFVVESGKTYTVTSNSQSVEFPSKTGSKSSYVTDGAGYDSNIASCYAKASADVASVTFTLTVADTVVSTYPALTIGANSISGVDTNNGTLYTLEIAEDGVYSFSGIDAYDIQVGTGVDIDFEENAAIDGILEANSDDTYNLLAGSYYVCLYANGSLTIAKDSAWDGTYDIPEDGNIQLDKTYKINYDAGDGVSSYGLPIHATIYLMAGEYKITFGGEGAQYAEVDTAHNYDPFYFTVSNDTAMLPEDVYELDCSAWDDNFNSVSATYTITITKVGEWDGEEEGGGEGGEEGGDFDPNNIPQLQVGDNQIVANKVYTFEVAQGGKYAFTGSDEGVVISTGYADNFGEIGPDWSNSVTNMGGTYTLVANTVYYVFTYDAATLHIERSVTSAD